MKIKAVAERRGDGSPAIPLKPPRRKRRWLSYSLRTLLLVTTMLGAALGVWVVPAERQRRAVIAIRGHDGKVRYDFEWNLSGTAAAPPSASAQRANRRRPSVPRQSALCRFLGIDYCADVVFVQMAPTTTDARLVHLGALPNLNDLYLGRTGITDAGLVHLSGLTDLQVLWIWGTKITDAGLIRISQLANLDDLNLSGTQVTDAGLVHLGALTQLKKLYLSGPRITDAGLVHLGRLTNLKYLGLHYTLVTEAGCERLRKALPNCTIWWLPTSNFPIGP